MSIRYPNQEKENLEDKDLGLYGAWLRATTEELTQRDCLRCSKEFTAKGRMNRVCKRCKKILEPVSDEAELPVRISKIKKGE